MKIPILENAVLFVNQTFLKSANPVPLAVERKSLGQGEEPPIAALAAQLRKLMAQHDSEKSRIDGAVAELLHRRLPLTRGEAAEMRFWHYLAVVGCPFYVAWRYFDERSGTVNRERYIGPLDRNALSRLWWFAELTMDRSKEDYSRTRIGSQSGEFVKGTVEYLLGGNRQVVSLLIDLLFREGSPPPPDILVNRLLKKINAALVTVAVDALLPEEIARLIAELYGNGNEARATPVR